MQGQRRLRGDGVAAGLQHDAGARRRGRGVDGGGQAVLRAHLDLPAALVAKRSGAGV